MNKVWPAILLEALCAYGVFGQTSPAGSSCPSLAQLSLSQAKVASAETVEPGAFTPPSNTSEYLRLSAALAKSLPAFCRVVAVAAPSEDSQINIEVWLPLNNWNGRFQGAGNGGFAGEIDYRQMAIALRGSYATAATDTGHTGISTDASWAPGHPEKVADYGHRGIHEMTRVAKAAIKSFYGTAPQHSYFGSCSNGGRQALMEAQRYPGDYDGILAGAPANFFTHLLASALWDAQATTAEPASYIPAAKLPAIAKAVNSACDAKDGVADGILNDPRQCRFDPGALLCKGADSDACLTQAQVTALRKLYQGARDSRGRQIFPGFVPGGETGEGGWGVWITGPEPGKGLLFAFNSGFFSNMVYEKPDWNYKTANLDEAVKAADDKLASVLNSTDPNLSAFKKHGGKLIVYHGWNDPAISALDAINYYTKVRSTMGEQNASSFVRLYLAPGMQHCAGGPGTDAFGQPGMLRRKGVADIQDALETWVEKGTPPSSIIAAKFESNDPDGKPKMTRPLCPYPQVAKYKGAGDPNDAVNFTCVTP
jgi:Tannase and feruloyl esterase